MKFRNELGMMFDETDYNVAMALFLVGCHCFVANNEREKGVYYIITSQTICRRMGYLNSDTYLQGLAFLTFQACKKELSVKSLQRFQEKMAQLNALPYRYIPLQGDPILDAIVEPSEYPDEQDFRLQEIHNLISKILVNVSTGFALVKLRHPQKAQQLGEEGSSGGHVNSSPAKASSGHLTERLIKYDDDGDEINQDYSGELIAKLVALNLELDDKDGTFKVLLPPPLFSSQCSYNGIYSYLGCLYSLGKIACCQSHSRCLLGSRTGGQGAEHGADLSARDTVSRIRANHLHDAGDVSSGPQRSSRDTKLYFTGRGLADTGSFETTVPAIGDPLDAVRGRTRDVQTREMQASARTRRR